MHYKHIKTWEVTEEDIGDLLAIARQVNVIRSKFYEQVGRMSSSDTLEKRASAEIGPLEIHSPS